MRIKRTYGATMREALAQVKLEQGPDAVILGNKKVPGGIEILSALDFDHRELDAYADRSSQSERESDHYKQELEPVKRTAAVASNLDIMPDFILNQSVEGRREPVLGMRQSAPVQKRPAAPVNKTPVRPPSQPKKSQQPAAAPRPAAPRVRENRSGYTPRNLPVEEEVAARKTQADKLLHNLRENQYQQQRPVQTEISSQPGMDEVKDELKNLRELMKSQLNVLEWDRYSQRNPVRSVLLNLMTELGIGADICELVMNQLGEINEDPHKVWQQALGILATAIPIASADILSSGGRIAMVGSTGVGKTTTIAKLAARFAHSHGKHSVALVTTDNFRIGAHEQLQHFARMLEIPLLTAKNSDELTDRLNMLTDKRLVLIDTAGMSQNDVRLSEQFHKLQHGSPEIRPYLVLSANTQLAALNQTIQNFGNVKLSGAVVTKLDEAASLGGIITASIRHQLPLTYCGTGQRVPEDLQQAKNHRLVSKAVSLMQHYAEQFDKETLAFRYNHIISQQ
jgi:flagellar biosynthesis protein FlhF